MKKSTLLGLVVAGVLVGALALWYVSGPDPGTVDLVERFPDAEKRSNGSLSVVFDVLDVTINGTMQRSIFAHPTSRIIWRLRVPPHAELQTSVALRDYAWTQEGDGVQFRVGVSDGKVYEDLAKLTVNPFTRAEDRRWMPVTVDLEKWGNQDVEVIFNTEPGPYGNAGHDAAVWGAPRIVPKS